MSDKIIKSHIIDHDKNKYWISTSICLPRENTPVMFIIRHNNTVTDSTETEEYMLEDVKIGKLVDSKWIVLPPYPKYDYSPLSKKANILPDATVVYWATVSEEDLIGWETRFDLTHKYEHLSLSVDKESEEAIYNALIWGAAAINQIAPNNKKELASRLYDLMNCIDVNSEE